MEYIRADDIRDIIHSIEPCSRDYCYQGVAETMVLDKQQEITDMLKGLEVVDVEDE